MDDDEERAVAEQAGAVLAHRRDVVRRLVARGLSPQALLTVLPGWGATIASALGDDPSVL